MGWVKDRQNTQKPKTGKKKNKKEQNTPSKAEQLQCAFRFAAIPGFKGLFLNDFEAILGYPLGYNFGAKSVKSRC